MTAQASHNSSPIPSSPEMARVEAIEFQGQGGEIQPTHNYGVYVLEGTNHPDGSNGLIFTFNPNILPIKDSETHEIARNIRLSLLPLKRKEHELKSSVAEKNIPERDLMFRVDANEAPIKVIKDGEIIDEDEVALDLLFTTEEQEEGYIVMHGWPAIRLDYDTSLIDQGSVIRAVGYALASQIPPSEKDIWIEDLSTGKNIERLIDPNAVKPGNPNKYVRTWIERLLEEEKPVEMETSDDNKLHTMRLSRIAASLSSLIKM